jgi:hypothetical protein
MKTLLISIIIVFSALTAQAQATSSGTKSKKLVSVGLMALNSSTVQGGTGPSGSSILTQSEFVWGFEHWGVGAMFDYDLHGSNEKDSAYGIKVEGYFHRFYAELGYLMSAKRAYTDRAIANETGTGTVFGFGARFPLHVGNGGLFFHASYKIKTQTLTEQDGVSISESIEQKDGYPIFGLGYSF